MGTKLRIIFATVLVAAAFVAINAWAATRHDTASHIATTGSYRANLANVY